MDERKATGATGRTYVAAFTIQRADGVSLMLRVMPGGGWRLREYDADGEEIGP